MVDIIRLNDDPHSQTQQLLPWYVTSTLDQAETALVERHLADCAECREDLALERGLASRMKALPGDADQGWAALKSRIETDRLVAQAPALPPRRNRAGWSLARAAGFAIAASVATFLVMRPPSLYRTLAALPGAATGNVVVIFRPDLPEAALRAVLVQNRARIVDGPTASDAYVLHVAEDQRDAVLARLKANHDIAAAEPIEGDSR
jgi:hypothetical protein